MVRKIQLWLGYLGDVLKYAATMLEQWPKFPDELKEKPKTPAQK